MFVVINFMDEKILESMHGIKDQIKYRIQKTESHTARKKKKKKRQNFAAVSMFVPPYKMLFD